MAPPTPARVIRDHCELWYLYMSVRLCVVDILPMGPISTSMAPGKWKLYQRPFQAEIPFSTKVGLDWDFFC